MIPQATHIFDVNVCDPLLHSVQKKRMRSFPAPLRTDHIMRDWKRAVSCERFVGMQMVRLMKVWFRDRFVIGMWTQKMSKTKLLNAKVIENGNDFFEVGVKSVSV